MANGPRITWKNVKGFLKTFIYLQDDHWLWLRSKDTSGYGQLDVDGIKWRAHRVSYIVHVGPIPSDKPHVLHIPMCRRRDCINPDHLYVGTNDDNMQDRDLGGYNGALKFTDAQIATIRQLVASGETQRSVADNLGVSYQHVSDLVNYKYRR